MTSSTSVSVWLILLFGFFHIHTLTANEEGDALNALKTNLADPNNVLQSWDPTLIDPCSWHYVTCNNESSVTHVDLGSANLSGQLVAQLGVLSKLQYLNLINNNITGNIPEELGGLSDLVSLDLSLNNFDGTIPATLGNLAKLSSLRLSNNNLSGNIPETLTNIQSLQVMDLSNNNLSGDIPVNGSFSLLTPVSFAYNPRLNPLPASPHPGYKRITNSHRATNTAAIAGGVVAGAALLFAATAIALAYWRRRKSQDHLFDEPG